MSKVKKNILVGCTGSVAAIKIPKLVDCLNSHPTIEFSVQVIATDHALHFFDRNAVRSKVYTNEDEWSAWQDRGDPVLHIDLGKWADVMVIAPLDANTLAKMANGLCDNFLLCITRAWDLEKPLLFCPAMNTRMWEHPITSKHIATLKEWGHREVSCISKTLMCGDTGLGAMAEVEIICEAVIASLLM